MLGEALLVLPLLLVSAHAACSDHYTNLVCAQSNPSLLQTSESQVYSCTYDSMAAAGQPPIAPTCTMTCPAPTNLIAYMPEFGSQLYLTSIIFDSTSWKGTPIGGGAAMDMGPTVQLGCLGTPRCGPYIDDTGTQFVTRCQTADPSAVCNEDPSLALCTCTAGYTGPTCSLPVPMLDKITDWLGPELTDKLLEIIKTAQKSPAALVDILPLIYAILTPEQKRAMSWNLDEVIDSIDYELKEVDYKFAFTQVFDDQLGNCYTFNYANKTNSFEGLYNTRFAGQSRDFSIMVKLDPTEQVAWIECSAISTYIHAPGTPATQGVMYSLRAAASDVIALQKSITKLIADCITTRAELKGNYYEDGDYTRDGCYSACYQDKVQEKCGCMDARFKKAESATQCLFKDNDCINSVSATYGEPSSWNSCHCPQACYTETYRIGSTRAALPYKIPNCDNVTDGCPDLSQTIARLTIYMDSLESQVYVEMEKMTLSTFLSQFGGQLGFLLGMSIVGILEILILCATLGKEQCCASKKAN